jgi:hypothetical protein
MHESGIVAALSDVRDDWPARQLLVRAGLLQGSLEHSQGVPRLLRTAARRHVGRSSLPGLQVRRPKKTGGAKCSHVCCSYTGPTRKGKEGPPRLVPAEIKRPVYVSHPKGVDPRETDAKREKLIACSTAKVGAMRAMLCCRLTRN